MVYSLIDDLTLTFEEQKILKEIVNSRKHKTFKGKYIVCNETGEKFKNRAEIAKKYNLTPSSVSHYFNGLQRTLKKMTFREVRGE